MDNKTEALAQARAALMAYAYGTGTSTESTTARHGIAIIDAVLQGTPTPPVAYAAFAKDGNIRMWCKGQDLKPIRAAIGTDPIPLYATPPLDIDTHSGAQATALLLWFADAMSACPADQFLDVIMDGYRRIRLMAEALQSGEPA